MERVTRKTLRIVKDNVFLYQCTQKPVYRLNWTEERAQAALDFLLKEGMAWIDDVDSSKGCSYWFPSLFRAAA